MSSTYPFSFRRKSTNSPLSLSLLNATCSSEKGWRCWSRDCSGRWYFCSCFVSLFLTFLPLEKVTAEWPVHERAKPALGRAAVTHNISPLPAYDEEHTLIAPNNYHRKLCGAIVQVHFAIVHYFIKQSKKSVFTAVAREILVLRSPAPAPVNPLKRARLSDGPAIGGSNDWKKYREVSTFPSIHFKPCNHSFNSFDSCNLSWSPHCLRKLVSRFRGM